MWNYINNQKDLELFMDNNSGFHNSALLECGYVTKRYSQVCTEQKEQVGVFRMIFQSKERYCNTLELAFEDIREVSLKPHYLECKERSKGSIIIMDEDGITWCDSSHYDEDYEIIYSSPDVTWVRAKKLKWRQNRVEIK